MKEESKGVKFFQNVGFYGSLACIPTTIFIGPALAFPAAICFLGVTATSVALDIERKRTLPNTEEKKTSSVSEILREFKRLNGDTSCLIEVDPSPIEEVLNIQNEIDELSSLQFVTKKRKEQELESKKQETIDDWEAQMAMLLSDANQGEWME